MIPASTRRLGIVALLAFVFCAAIPVKKQPASAVRLPITARRISFNEHWRFYKGEATRAEKPTFDDSQWAEIRLPHDWAIDGPFDPKLDPQTGALPISGMGWYRKSFLLSENAN